jgi:hypothetical protein
MKKRIPAMFLSADNIHQRFGSSQIFCSSAKPIRPLLNRSLLIIKFKTFILQATLQSSHENTARINFF